MRSKKIGRLYGKIRTALFALFHATSEKQIGRLVCEDFIPVTEQTADGKPREIHI